MRQSLPLPERIPTPSEKVRQEMIDCGILLEDSSEKYITYTLPDGWKMVDASWRDDLPDYKIIDSENNIRFTIHGAWKRTYDNDIKIYANRTPYDKYEQKVSEQETE